jgi:transcriptional regulator with XRE-family HTH domain
MTKSLLKQVSFAGLARVVLRDIRESKEITQAGLAARLNKTTSAWTKIENGDSQLSMDVVFAACEVLLMQPSEMMKAIEIASIFLSHHGFKFVYDIEPENDDFLTMAKAFYQSPGYKKKRRTILGISNFGVLMLFPQGGVIPDVIKYCIDKDYRKLMDSKGSNI